MMSYTIPCSGAEQTPIYKTVGEQALRLTFLPPTETIYSHAPVYLIIPGGGWSSADKEAMLDFSSRSVALLRARGFAAVSIEYRVFPQEGLTMDAIVSDVMDAGRYLAHFSEILGIDPRKIVTSGHSAGGHLALMMALAPQEAFALDSPFDPIADAFGVIGSIPLCPPTVLYPDDGWNLPLGFSAEAVVRRDMISEQLRAAHRASPIDYLNPCSVPILLAYGTHDPIVLPESAHLFARRANRVGAKCTLLGSVYGGHCFEPMVDGQVSCPDFGAVQEELVGFVQTLL